MTRVAGDAIARLRERLSSGDLSVAAAVKIVGTWGRSAPIAKAMSRFGSI